MPKLLSTTCILAVLVAALGVLAVPAMAGFVSGVERFDGTSLDSTTWEAYYAGAMSQTDSLTIDARTIPGADYSTVSLALNVGQAVSVEVTPRLMHEGIMGLYLSNDSAGVSARMYDDSQFYGLAWVDDWNAIGCHTTGGDTAHIVEGDHPLNTTYIYRIDRPNLTQIVFSVYSADGTLLGSQTVTSPAFTTGPYVSLVSYYCLANFGNVRILNSGDPQPLPTAAPTFSPDSGQYVPSATVTISCATPGATIYYTTNGSEPSDTNGTPISSGGTVLVDQNTLLKARAYVGVEGSSVKEATYITTSSSFVDGVDRFNGIVLDPYTWESFYDYIASMKLRFSQNDALTIDARPIAGQDYTTVSQTVGVGQAVSVEVTPTYMHEGAVGLFLTNNSGGTSARVLDDSQFYGVAWWEAFNAIITHTATGVYNHITEGNHPLNTTYIYRVDRPSATQAVFSVYSADGTLLGSQTLSDLPEFSAGPYVSMTSYMSICTFDNVRIMNGSTSVPGAKAAADGTGVTFSGIVSAVFTDYFYAEDPNRAYGIRVNKAGHGIGIGQAVSGAGVMDTLGSGERCIIAIGSISASGTGQIRPLGMNNKAVGGGDLGTPPNGQCGVAGGTGLNNIGLLVKTTGRLVTKGTGWYTIDDGSGVTVKVIGNVPTDTSYISVTGISSLETPGGTRVILATSDAQGFVSAAFRPYPLRNGDFSYTSRLPGEPAGYWSTFTWNGQYNFTTTPPQDDFPYAVHAPCAAVITAVTPGRAALYQDVDLMEGEYAFSGEVRVTGSGRAWIVIGEISYPVSLGDGRQQVYFKFHGNGSVRIYLILSGGGSAEFRNVMLLPVKLSSSPVPLTNGERIGSIVIGNNPTPAEDYAAYELQRYIYAMTGLIPGLEGRDAVFPGIRIFVGGEPGADLAGLPSNSYGVSPVSDKLYLLGNDDLGTLYAVYDFLKLQGCGWYFPGKLGEVVPTRSSLVMPAERRIESPDFDVRGLTATSGNYFLDGRYRSLAVDEYIDYAVRNRLNALWDSAYFIDGQKVTYDFGAYRGHGHLQTTDHSWGQFLFNDHTEWWPLVNGQRRRLSDFGLSNQLCVNPNNGLRDHVVQTVLEFFGSHPDYKVFALNAEDSTGYWCECMYCRALDADGGTGHFEQPEGRPNISMTDRSLHFVNEVAQRVSSVYPDKLIEMYAYTQTIEPPKRERVHPNVLIKYCWVMRPPASRPIMDQSVDAYKSAISNLDGWKAAGCTNLALYDYNNYIYPECTLFDFFSTSDTLRTLKTRYGLSHVLGQTESSQHASMMLYNVRSAALWDVDVDYRTIVSDVCTNFYGPAAGTMLEYYNFMEGRLMESDAWTEESYDPLNFEHFDIATALEGKEILGRAGGQVTGQPVYEARVDIAKYGNFTLIYYLAQLSETPLSDQDRQNATDAFYTAREIAARYGLTTSFLGRDNLADFYLP